MAKNQTNQIGNMDLVSVVVCTYNGEKYLREQLNSICNQTYNNIEVLLFDDCSTDDTVLIANEFAHNYPFLKVFKNEFNLGVNQNMKHGFTKALGKYICPSDQDDVWELEKIEILVNLIKSKNCSLVYCNSYITDENLTIFNNKKLKKNLEQNDVTSFIDGNNYLNLIILNCISGHAMLFEKELANNVLSDNQGCLYYDQWLGISALLQKGVFYTLQPLVHFRRHNSAETNVSKTFNESFIYIKDCLIHISNHPLLNLNQKKYINQLITNFENNKNFLNKLSLFYYLLRNINSIFKIRNKNIFSHIVYARKLAFKFTN